MSERERERQRERQRERGCCGLARDSAFGVSGRELLLS
jgi:hypothetical protein